MVDLVPQVSLELRVDQESPVDQDHKDQSGRRVCQEEMGSQDRLESKEIQEFLATAFPVLLEFQGCQVKRETLVLLVQLVARDFPALKGMSVSKVSQVLRV